MKRQNSNVLISVAAASLVAGAVVGQAQFTTMALYEFGTESPGTLASTDADLLSVASTLSVASFTGTGTVTGGNPGYCLQMPENGIPNKNRDTAFYLEFTVDPNAGRQLNLQSFSFDAQVYRTSATRNWSLRSDLNGDNYGTELGGGQFSNTGWSTISAPDFGDAFQGLASAVTFRFYLWDQGNLSNPNDGLRLDNIQLTGTNVPEPASAGLLAGLGLGAFAFLRRRVTR